MGVIGALCKTLRDVKCGCCVSNRDPESGEVLRWHGIEQVVHDQLAEGSCQSQKLNSKKDYLLRI